MTLPGMRKFLMEVKDMTARKSELFHDFHIKLFLCFFGLAIVPLSRGGTLSSSVNSENVVLGLTLLFFPFYALLVGYRNIRFSNIIVVITLSVVILSLWIAVFADTVTSDFLRLTTNFLFAWFTVSIVISPIQKKGLLISKYLSISLAALLVAYISLFMLSNGLIITKLYASGAGYNVNAYMNLFNLAALFIVLLRIGERANENQFRSLTKADEVMLQSLVLLIIAICAIQQTRQNFLAAILIFLSLNLKYLKYIIPVALMLVLYFFQELQEQSSFFNYFLKAFNQILSGTETTRSAFIAESYNSIGVLPDKYYSHPFDNTFATLLVAAGLFAVPYILIILASLILILRISIFLGIAFFVLVILNDQQLEFSFWLIILYVINLCSLKLRAYGRRAHIPNSILRKG